LDKIKHFGSGLIWRRFSQAHLHFNPLLKLSQLGKATVLEEAIYRPLGGF